MILRALVLFCLFPILCAAEPEAEAKAVRVAILGYHDFSETEIETQMKIRTSKFRLQMQAIRDLGLYVISIEDFQAWKRGEKSIPNQSVVITIDDGWKSVYTEAFPILKEFDYPFALFLYKNYVDGGGRALTIPMIEEMKKHGASIASHSVSHPYPASVKKYRRQGPDAYDAFLRREMGESKRFLESKFGLPITNFAYPGGFQTQEMFSLAEEFGYQHLYTVRPAKVRIDTPDHSLPRYMILGTHDRVFELATTFTTNTGTASSTSTVVQTTPFPVEPEAGSLIEDRLPMISAMLADAGEIDPESLVMKVGGFGPVPASFNPETRIFSWKINRCLRSPSCQVQVNWKDMAGNAPEIPLRWSFQIDQEASYVPRTPAPNDQDL